MSDNARGFRDTLDFGVFMMSPAAARNMNPASFRFISLRNTTIQCTAEMKSNYPAGNANKRRADAIKALRVVPASKLACRAPPYSEKDYPADAVASESSTSLVSSVNGSLNSRVWSRSYIMLTPRLHHLRYEMDVGRHGVCLLC